MGYSRMMNAMAPRHRGKWKKLWFSKKLWEEKKSKKCTPVCRPLTAREICIALAVPLALWLWQDQRRARHSGACSLCSKEPAWTSIRSLKKINKKRRSRKKKATDFWSEPESGVPVPHQDSVEVVFIVGGLYQLSAQRQGEPWEWYYGLV
jgi:hypothetical protein